MTTTKKSIAVTPVIRARTSAPAFVATGHNHDDRYIRYDATQSGLDSTELNTFLSNLLAGATNDAKLVRTDITQALSTTNKDRARENIGIVDDRNVADSNGDILVSAFGNRINGANVTNNDLLSHFVRFDAAQTISNPQKAQFATNTGLLSLLNGLSSQTIQSPLSVTSTLGVTGVVTLSGAATVQGTPTGDTLATVRIGNPDGSRTSIIHISSASGTTGAITAMSCGGKRIENVGDPTGDQDVSTKKYVDDQLDALDLDASYLRADGQNAATANLNAGNFQITNLGLPTSVGHATNKAYVDASSNILAGVNNTTAGGFTTASTSISPTTTGKYLVIVSGKVTSGSAGVLAVNVIQNASTIATRALNTDGDSQWSLTIPVTIASIANPIFVGGSAGIVFNQFDLVKIGN